MNMKNLCIIIFIVIITGITIKSCNTKRMSSLADWQKETQLDKYKILDSLETEDFYICVFKSDTDEIVVCPYWRGNSKQKPNNYSLIIYDKKSKIMHEDTRSLYNTGCAYGIESNYKGDVKIEFEITWDDGSHKPFTYAKSLIIP